MKPSFRLRTIRGRSVHASMLRISTMVSVRFICAAGVARPLRLGANWTLEQLIQDELRHSPVHPHSRKAINAWLSHHWREVNGGNPSVSSLPVERRQELFKQLARRALADETIYRSQLKEHL